MKQGGRDRHNLAVRRYSRRAFGQRALAAIGAGVGPPLLAHDLAIALPGGKAERLAIGAALRRLRIPSVSIALIERGRLAWTRVYGAGSARTPYQAASLSKLVTAAAALRLVQRGRLALDRDVDAELVSWRLPNSDPTRGHPITLRGLLSMTGGIGVPGGAIGGAGHSLVLMKRGQNIGYQNYMLIFPESGQGIVVMTGSDNGTILATALVRRAAALYGWPPLGALAD
ncbi:MAG TPA: serine hydrolase domain-containing protein [Stellaceae bacterium]|nr:serine hydrolase domain-containing protein [Stellaceae bacterium]